MKKFFGNQDKSGIRKKILKFVTAIGRLFKYAILVGAIEKPVYTMEWQSKAGIDKSGSEEKVLLWSSVYNTALEGGVFYYGNSPIVFGEGFYSGDVIDISGGFLRRSFESGFILSHGEYFPGDNSTPDQRPVGLSFAAKSPGLNFFWGSFMNAQKNKISLASLAFNLNASGWFLALGTGLSGTQLLLPVDFFRKLKEDKNFSPFFSLRLEYLEFLKLETNYSLQYGWLGILKMNLKRVQFNLYLMSLKLENDFSAKLYQINRHYYLSVIHDYLNIKIYDLDQTLHMKATVKVNDFGFYNYVNGKKVLTGIFYHAEQKGLSPYFSLYVVPGTKAVIHSLGVNYKTLWMFALVHSQNNTKNYYPCDEEIIPKRFYYSGVRLESETGFNHSYLGFQFYWDSQPLFFYASVLQNYALNTNDSIAVTLRLEYIKKF